MGGSPVSPPAHSLLVAEQGLTPSWPPGPSSQPWAPAAAGPQAGVGRAEALQAFRQLMLYDSALKSHSHAVLAPGHRQRQEGDVGTSWCCPHGGREAASGGNA